MKYSNINILALSSLLVCTSVFAAESDFGELIISGKVVGTTCKFIGETNARIDMNQIGADRLNDLNSGQVYDGYSNTTITPLNIECSGENPPIISFSRSQFDPNHPTITINTASDNGAGFAVYHGETLINSDDTISLDKKDNGKYSLNFTAKYANVSGKNSITPGEVSSSLTLTVVTD